MIFNTINQDEKERLLHFLNRWNTGQAKFSRSNEYRANRAFKKLGDANVRVPDPEEAEATDDRILFYDIW